MTALESLLLAYLMNAAWQLPLLAGMALLLLRCLRQPSPRLEYAVWFLTTALAALLPLAVGLGLFGSSHFSPEGPSPGLAVPDVFLRLVLWLAVLASLTAGLRLLRAAAATLRLRRQTKPHFLRQGVEVRISPPELAAAGPVLIGIWHPVILVPDFLTKPVNAPLLDAALAHELAHVERRDMLTHSLAEILLLPLVLHPVTGWLRRHLHAARELACDAQATVDSIEYAKCLLAMARHTLEPARHLNVLGIGSAQILERRIHALAVPSTRILTRREKYLAAILLLVACGFLAVAARKSYLWFTSVPAPASSLRTIPPPPPPRVRKVVNPGRI